MTLKDADDFKNFFQNKAKDVEKYINSNEAAMLAANEAVGFYKENFEKEGFRNEGLEKWQEVKRRQNPKNFKTITRGKNAGAVRANNAGSRKILTGRGALRRSIQWRQVGAGRVIIYSDLPYARVHNEGLKAGRGKGFVMPKRQFMGASIELQQHINAKLRNRTIEKLKTK